MNERQRTIALLGGTLALMVAVALVVPRNHGDGYDWTRDHSSLQKNPWGTAGYRELLDRTGVRTESWEQSLTELGPETNLLMLLDPRSAISDEEREHLLDWVEGGGRLVIAPFGDATSLAAMLGSGSSGFAGYMGVSALLSDLGLELTDEGDAGREGEVVTRSEITRGVNVVGVPSRYRLARTKHGTPSREGIGEPRTDVAVGTQAVMMSLPVGEGIVHVIAEVEMLANGEIGENDNAILAANIVFADGAPDVVYFDERSVKWASEADENGPKVDSRPLNNVLLALLVIAIIYAMGRAQRFGAAVPPDDDTRRARSDYVRAFAEIYARAQASEAATEMLATGLRRRMSRAAGTTPAAPVERIAERLDRRGLPGAEMAALLAELEATGAHLTDKELIRLARRIADYERML